jgi:hypothetical protein
MIRTGNGTRLRIVAILIVALAPALSHGQAIDLNTYYAFPWSMGVSFSSVSPFGDGQVPSSTNVYAGATVRVPIPTLPFLQPFATLGVNLFTPDTAADPKNSIYANTQVGTQVGIGYSNRMAKNFEVGADLSLGYQFIYFPEINVLNPESPAARSDNLVATAAVRVALDPSYSMAIDVVPSLTYRYCLQPGFTSLNGFTFGVGATVNYRLGEDPDAPKAAIRSISFGDVAFPPLYAAMQSYYAKNAFAKVAVKNVEKFAINDVQVTFFQNGYMDTPTKLASIPTLEAGKTVEVPVVASFNAEVFNTNGDTPLNGEITVEYMSHNRPAKQSTTVSYVLYDRTSISWDDDRKEAAFITRADTALRNYATYIRQAIKDRTIAGYSEPVQTAIGVFYALKELGVIYQLALTSSFAAAQSNPLTVDHVHLPRETLQRKAGDCSDLTALFCAIMESVGFPTGFITVPGHIYPVFGTKIPTASFRDVYPDKSMTFDVDGELWIPVEITMVGTSDFMTAWRKGIEEWNALEKDSKSRAIYFTAKCQEVFHAVGLKEEDLGLQYGEAKKIADNFRNTTDKIIDGIIDSYNAVAANSNNKADYNKVGIVAAQYNRYDQALKALNTALALDRNYLSAQINLGNVYFLQQDYQSALKVFHQALEAMDADNRQGSSLYGRVLLSLARSYYELESYDQAASFYDKALAIDSSISNAYGYLKSGQGGAGASGSPAAQAPGGQGLTSGKD